MDEKLEKVNAMLEKAKEEGIRVFDALFYFNFNAAALPMSEEVKGQLKQLNKIMEHAGMTFGDVERSLKKVGMGVFEYAQSFEKGGEEIINAEISKLNEELSKSAKRRKEYKEVGAYEQEAQERSTYSHIVSQIDDLEKKIEKMHIDEKISNLQSELIKSGRRREEYNKVGAYEQEAQERSTYSNLVSQINDLKVRKEYLYRDEKIADLNKKLEQSGKRLKEYKEVGAYEQEAQEYKYRQNILSEIEKIEGVNEKRNVKEEKTKNEEKKTKNEEEKIKNEEQKTKNAEVVNAQGKYTEDPKWYQKIINKIKSFIGKRRIALPEKTGEASLEENSGNLKWYRNPIKKFKAWAVEKLKGIEEEEIPQEEEFNENTNKEKKSIQEGLRSDVSDVVFYEIAQKHSEEQNQNLEKSDKGQCKDEGLSK